jgi:hypothetical protein
MDIWRVPRRAVPDRLLNEKAGGLFGAQKGLNPPAGAVSQDKTSFRSTKTNDLIGDRRKIRKMPAPDDPLQNGAAILFSSVENEVRHAAREYCPASGC